MRAHSSVALLCLLAACADGTVSSVQHESPDANGVVGPTDASTSMADGGPSSSLDAGSADGGPRLPSDSPWPVPIPGSPGTGPACPEPVQGPIGADWPEVFVGVGGCDDSGSGSRATPFCTFARAFEVADAAPYIVTVLDGTYRERGFRLTRPGSASEYFVVRADEGARPVILGSDPILGSSFESAGTGLVRVDVSSLTKDPTGFWTAEGHRIIHVMEFRNGTRSHANVADLVDSGTWTKADGAGNGCDSGNAGCFIYMRPPAGLDVSVTAFEASQASFFHSVGGNYQVVDGLTIRFTQSTAIFFEGAHHILIQNGDFAHNANGSDNSYNLRLWGADGALVRRNRVSDSRYWGGAVNSHGITFMVTGDQADIWVCENEVFDSIGFGVSTKGGSSNIHVVGNYLHDLGTGVATSSLRCDWRGCDEHLFPGGGYTIRENLFERCGSGVGIARTTQPDEVFPSRVFNNLFVETRRGIDTVRESKQPLLRNNVFIGSGHGLHFKAGGTITWPDFYIAAGYDSDYNLFDAENAVYVVANWSGLEESMSLSAYQADYGAEGNSTDTSADLDDRFAPRPGSPAIGTGDPSVYEGATRVNRGLWPFATP